LEEQIVDVDEQQAHGLPVELQPLPTAGQCSPMLQVSQKNYGVFELNIFYQWILKSNQIKHSHHHKSGSNIYCNPFMGT
jgi:hypothetical protein